MNRYCYVIIMVCVFFASPCFAMLNPFGYGQFQPQSAEQEVKEPELTGLYQGFVATSDEPSGYTPEQVQEESVLPEEFAEEPFREEQTIIKNPIVENPEAPLPFVQPSSSPQESALQTPAQSSLSMPPSAQQIPVSAQPSIPIPPSAQPIHIGQQTPVSPATQPTPTGVQQPPVRSTAPGKAHESITKANSKLSSAIRRLDAIKGYYKEIPQEDRRVIKTKAENVLKEYQNGITKFAHRIGQVKNELGDRADKEKLAPFNTFIDLVNKLSQGIKRL